MAREQAKFIWTDRDGAGYNRYAFFRRAFELEAPPQTGTLHLFADTRYRLCVNGTVVGHGPARFFVARPEHDTWDLTPFLRRGRNVIAVTVNSYGCYSFHSEKSLGGLIAWGEAVDEAGASVELATGPDWKALDSPAHRRETPKLSFALNPGEMLDARLLPDGWEAPDSDDSDWPAATALDAQDHWGELVPRSIPPLDERRVLPRKRIGTWVGQFVEQEDLHSFVLTSDGHALHDRGGPALALTYLHSPRQQRVTLGAWWGHYWLNGQPLEPTPRRDVQMRQDFEVILREGWNCLQVLETAHFGAWEFYLGVPRGAGVSVSAEMEEGSPDAFLLAGPWHEPMEGLAERLGLPLDSPDDLPEEFGPWQAWPRGEGAESAYAERAWKQFSPLPHASAIGVKGRQYASAVGDGALVLLYDFGGEMLGRPVLEFDAAEGTAVDLAYSERLEEGRPADHGRHHVRMAERCRARAGRQSWQTFHPRGFRYLEVLVSGDLGAFELHDVSMTRANYPVREIGSFRCSDPLLNDIWELGRATQHACMEDAFLDCPRRERGLYSGDFLVQFFTNLAAYGDAELMRRCIELFFLSQDERGFVAPGAHGLRPGRHPDYTAILAQALWHYYARTGDLEFPRRMKDGFLLLVGALEGLQVEGLGLYDGSELSPYLDLQVMDRGGINCALNCFYQRAFHDAARILEALDDADGSRACRERADRLAEAIRREFWDGGRGVFLDRRLEDAPGAGPSVAANALPLLYDIADEGQAPSALDWMEQAVLDNWRGPAPDRERGCNVMSYFSFYALGVLYRYGRAEAAERFIRKCWGWMLDHGAWTCWETFLGGSQCHAWSSSPTHYLSTSVLGIGFPEPGNVNRVRIAPQPGSLTWAEGTYPHPAGPIYLKWEVKGERLLLECELPEGVEVETAEEV